MTEQYKRITLLPYDLDGLAIACEQYLHNDYARVAHQAAARIRELEAQVAACRSEGQALYDIANGLRGRIGDLMKSVASNLPPAMGVAILSDATKRGLDRANAEAALKESK